MKKCIRVGCQEEVEDHQTFCKECLEDGMATQRRPICATDGCLELSVEGTHLCALHTVMSKQIGGNHYKKNSIQPWDIIDDYGLDFYEGNALKYLLRDKSPTDAGKRREDLEKAIHYIEKKLTEWDEHPKQAHIEFEAE